MGSRRRARECALQMLFAADVSGTCGDELARGFWSELADGEMEPDAREFATRLALGTLANLEEVDARIRSRAEHWTRNCPPVFNLRSHPFHQRNPGRDQGRSG
ncbi:MAG: hypothetical protein DMF70_10590 [Acidobacteria bacterium]|nr:MAG: hypothetical protein DMF70_10590 [Acidobacteriota bacterium]